MTYYNTKHTRKKFHIDGPEKSHRPQRKEPLVDLKGGYWTIIILFKFFSNAEPYSRKNK